MPNCAHGQAITGAGGPGTLDLALLDGVASKRTQNWGMITGIHESLPCSNKTSIDLDIDRCPVS